MRPIEDIAREVVEHGNPKNLPVLPTGPEIVELAKAALFWRDRFERAREQFDGWRRQNEHLRDALRIAETTRNAAQDIASRETERRREVEERRGLTRDEYDAGQELLRALGEESARAEAEALRELAWSWCIEASQLRELLRRVVKYAREDRAYTPGSTRLARVILKAAHYIGMPDRCLVCERDQPCGCGTSASIFDKGVAARELREELDARGAAIRP